MRPSTKINKIVRTILEADVTTTIHTEVMHDMILSYVLSKFEDLIAEYLMIIFKFKPEALRSSKSLTHEEILKHASLDELKDSMIKKEIDSVLRESIEKINEYLTTKFNLDWSNDADWKKLVECVYRRNCIVHNDALPNDEYIQKIRPSPIPATIHADEKYTDEVAALLEREAEKIKDFSSKFC